MFDLKGKVAVITGASRGVGKGVALGLGETPCISGMECNAKIDNPESVNFSGFAWSRISVYRLLTKYSFS